MFRPMLLTVNLSRQWLQRSSVNWAHRPLINNAGLLGPIEPIWEVDPEEWWRVWEVNVKGSMLCSRTVLKDMVVRRGVELLTCRAQGPWSELRFLRISGVQDGHDTPGQNISPWMQLSTV